MKCHEIFRNALNFPEIQWNAMNIHYKGKQMANLGFSIVKFWVRSLMWKVFAFHKFSNWLFLLFLVTHLDEILEANQNKNNYPVSNFYNKLKFPAFFSVRNRWEKSAQDFNVLCQLLTRQSFLFWFPSKDYLISTI